MTEPTKTIEDYFADWEGSAFGFGYGAGEPHIIPALKTFLECAGERETQSEASIQMFGRSDSIPNSFDYRILEERLTPTVAWLLINVLCRHNVETLEYGTSPRHPWLTTEGVRLKEFVCSRDVEELVEIVTGRDSENDNPCYPDACNCSEHGYVEGKLCPNPFWPRRGQMIDATPAFRLSTSA